MVIGGNETFDGMDQFFDVSEGAPSNGLLGNDVEPDFNLIEP